MSKRYVVAVRDNATGSFSDPVFVAHRGVAIRSFGDEVRRKEPGNAMAVHPNDFDLWFLGEWDSDSGMFGHVEPERIARARDFVEV